MNMLLRTDAVTKKLLRMRLSRLTRAHYTENLGARTLFHPRTICPVDNHIWL
jgi:hypothetical protein